MKPFQKLFSKPYFGHYGPIFRRLSADPLIAIVEVEESVSVASLYSPWGFIKGVYNRGIADTMAHEEWA